MYGFQLTYDATKAQWVAKIVHPNGHVSNTHCQRDTAREAADQALDMIARLNSTRLTAEKE